MNFCKDPKVVVSLNIFGNLKLFLWKNHFQILFLSKLFEALSIIKISRVGNGD